MSLVKKRKTPRMVILSNDQLGLYQLKMKSGYSLKIQASQLVRRDQLYLFMYRRSTECFAEIPEQAVEQLELLSQPGEVKSSVFHSSYVSGSKKYLVRFPDQQVCFVVASNDEWAGEDAQFFCHEIPFLTIYNASGCQFDLCAWQ